MNGFRAAEGLILQEDDLRLRQAVLPADARLAQAWYTDPEVMYFSEGDKDARYDLPMIEKMYRCLADQGELYIAELLIAGQWVAIGDVTLAPDTLPIVIGEAQYRSQGYGKRLISLLIDRARALGWPQLRVKSIYTFNQRSRRLFESLGFEQDGDVFLEDDIPSCKFVKQL